MNRPRVLLADDYAPLLKTWQRLLEPWCDVVSSVTDGRALLDAASKLHPDIVVVDLAMPEVDGFEACRRLKQSPAHQPKVIVVTASDDISLASKAFEVGASAYVLKFSAGVELWPAIQTVMLGHTYCTPNIGRRRPRG
jgi:CheY-like chemotaxis protein